MKVTLLGEKLTVMHSPFGAHDYFAWPTAARLKNGKIAVGASGFRVTHICPFGKAALSYGNENGELFSPPSIVIDTPLDDRDTGLCPFGESGLIVTSFNNTVEFQRQCNSTRPDTSTRKKYINAYLDTISEKDEQKYLGNTFRISRDNGVTFGELYKSPVTSPHGPVELSDGTVLWLGTETENAEAFIYEGKKEIRQQISAYSIDTETGKAERIGTVNTDVIKKRGCVPSEPYAVELGDGKILCHIRADNALPGERFFTLYQSVSLNGGKTWSEPRQLLADFGGAPSHIIKHSSGILISAYSYRLPPFGIKVMFSRDGGDTWSNGQYIYSSEAGFDLGYPSTVELSDGSLFTAFYAKDEEEEPAKIFAQKWRFEQ